MLGAGDGKGGRVAAWGLGVVFLECGTIPWSIWRGAMVFKGGDRRGGGCSHMVDSPLTMRVDCSSGDICR